MNPHVIDAHHHLWRYNPAEFDWIDDSMGLLRTDFLPHDLLPLLGGTGVDSTIAVQARQSLQETAWLLSLADQHETIAAVVAWLPLTQPNISEIIAQHSHPRMKGVRQILQAEPASYMQRPDFNRGIRALTAANLTYDLLLQERQLQAAIQLVDCHPNQLFILDHLAKPKIKASELEPWATNLRALAQRENVLCKLSGMVTEAHWRRWSSASLAPYFNVALEAFGPHRLLFGSDWPVCLLAASYAQWIATARTLIAPLSHGEQAAILGANAIRAYRLNLSNHAL